MGIFTLIFIVTVAAAVFASLFTANSNYLDTNINGGLDVMNHLGLKIEMTPDIRKQVNNLLIPKLSIPTRLSIINAEIKRSNNRSFTTDVSSTVNKPVSPSTAESISSSREKLTISTPREI